MSPLMRRAALKLAGMSLVLAFAAACSGPGGPGSAQGTTPDVTHGTPAPTATSAPTTEPRWPSGETLTIELTKTGRFGVQFDCPAEGECGTTPLVDNERVGPLFVRLQLFESSNLERVEIQVTNEGDEVLQMVTVTDAVDFTQLSKFSSASTATGSSNGANTGPTSATNASSPEEPVTRIEEVIDTASSTLGSCTVRQTGANRGTVNCTIGVLGSGRSATVGIVFSPDLASGDVVNTFSITSRI